MRLRKEIVDYMDEAWDRVWLNRKYNLFYDVIKRNKPLHPEQFNKIKKEMEKIIDKYHIQNNDGNLNDWDYGFWSGVLATTRWILGEESKRMLDT